MPLNKIQIKQLELAIKNYNFPCAYFDFSIGKPAITTNMAGLETIIKNELNSNIKHGLANIVFWGYSNFVGRQKIRFKNFLYKTSNMDLKELSAILKSKKPSPTLIKKLKLPQFSGLSFISKIIMFNDTQTFATLDLQISKLRSVSGRSLSSLKMYSSSIPVSPHNEAIYFGWCDECKTISQNYFASKYSVVDIERGFFEIIRFGRLSDALMIYRDF